MVARLLRIGQFWLLLLLVTAFSLYPWPPAPAAGNDKLLHFCAYLALLLSLAVAHRPAGRAGLAQVGLLFAWSLLIEVVQYFLPNRHFSLADLAANLAGLLLGAALVAGCGRWRASGRRP